MNTPTTTPLRLTVTDLHGNLIDIPIKRNVSAHTIEKLCVDEADRWHWGQSEETVEFAMNWVYTNKNGVKTVGCTYITMDFA